MKEESMTQFTINFKIINIDAPTDESHLLDISRIKWFIPPHNDKLD